MTKSSTNSPHVEFEDDDSDGSDGASQSLEVTFDPTNPYRRKSSLVSSEAKKPHPHPKNPARRDECIVHQFLESQRRAKHAYNDNGADQYMVHPVCTGPDNQPNGVVEPSSSNKTETKARAIEKPSVASRQQHEQPSLGNGDGKGESKGSSSRCVIDPKCLEPNGRGQPDQQAWTTEMTKSTSELDLSQNEDVRSRMLTKKQLSDMAWGVRELSRRLSSMRIRLRVKTVFILTKIYDPELVVKTRQLVQWLLGPDRQDKYTIFVQDKLKASKKFDVNGLLGELAREHLASAAAGGVADADGHGEKEEQTAAYNAALDDVGRRLRYWDEDMCQSRPHTFDFVITLGGDGTVLYASWLFQRIVPPVLSFALGSLGFLTKFDFDEFAPTLNSAFSNGVTCSLRLRFEGTVMRSQKFSKGEISSGSSEEEDDEARHFQRDLVEELVGEEKEDVRTHRPEGTYEILNEIVVDRGPNPSKLLDKRKQNTATVHDTRVKHERRGSPSEIMLTTSRQ